MRHLQTLLEVARALNAATVLEDVVHVVLQAAVRLLRADRGCVILIENGERRTVACHPRDLPETSWAAHSSLFDRALAERRVVHAGVELSPSTTMVARGAALAVAAPLVVARRPIGPAKDASFVATVEVIGGIMVERAKAGQRFGKEDLAVLESLAADAAVAIDSARLYRETREKAKIDHEMALARTIQAALLRPPPQVPFADVFAFSQSARIVGGDLYHAAVREDGALAVALGDVSGKGVAAALIMAMVQGLLGLLHELGQPIASVLPALNRSLIEHNPGNRFLTLGAGVLAADGTLELANAGHCPLAVLRGDGTVQLVPPKGPILGLLPDATWGTDTLRLAPGESVVFYSDGVSESFAPKRRGVRRGGCATHARRARRRRRRGRGAGAAPGGRRRTARDARPRTTSRSWWSATAARRDGCPAPWSRSSRRGDRRGAARSAVNAARPLCAPLCGAGGLARVPCGLPRVRAAGGSMKRLAAIDRARAVRRRRGAASAEAAAGRAGPYDPAVDGWKQVQAAASEAATDGKRVLVVVGGNWCPWCRALDRLMTEDAALRSEVAAHYELVHLNYSKENKNPEAMARLGNPDKLGFPSFVVLSPQLTVLHTPGQRVVRDRRPETARATTRRS